MTKHKGLLIFSLFTIFVFGTAAQTNCDSKKNKNTTAASINSNGNMISDNKKPTKTPQNDNGEVKTLAEGSYGNIEQPFLFIVRSAETYRQLQSIFEELPAVSEVDFNKQMIIGAFAGTKNTGGYSVGIKKTGEKISISVINPPKDAMLTQALTMPYKVAMVPVEAEESLNLEVSANWKNAARTFKLSSSEFESSGGITGRLKKFAAQGTIGVWQFGDLVTFDFNLSGTEKNMQLKETVSGVAKNGKVDLMRLDTGTFSEGPKPPVKATGTIAGDKLTLSFEPLPTNIRDGFQVSGKLEAVRSK